MYTSAVAIPEQKRPFLGSVPWLVFGTAPTLLTRPFEQIWSTGFGTAPLVLAGPLGPIGQPVSGSEPIAGPCIVPKSDTISTAGECETSRFGSFFNLARSAAMYNVEAVTAESNWKSQLVSLGGKKTGKSPQNRHLQAMLTPSDTCAA